MSSLCTKIRSAAGIHPDPLNAYSAPLDPLAGFSGKREKGTEGEKRDMGKKSGREGNGKKKGRNEKGLQYFGHVYASAYYSLI